MELMLEQLEGGGDASANNSEIAADRTRVLWGEKIERGRIAPSEGAPYIVRTLSI